MRNGENDATEAKIIGFFGTETYDIMLLAAKKLQAEGKRVLLLDCGNSGALSASVPVPEELDAREFIIEHNGLFFSCREIEMQMCRSFDFIFIEFGMLFKHRSAGICTQLLYAADLLPRHIEPLLTAVFLAERLMDILLRDVVYMGGRGRELVRQLEKAFPQAALTLLSADKRDMKNRYVCECDYEYEVRHASLEMQGFIRAFTEKLCPKKGGR